MTRTINDHRPVRLTDEAAKYAASHPELYARVESGEITWDVFVAAANAAAATKKPFIAEDIVSGLHG